jgi:hypothetical protein
MATREVYLGHELYVIEVYQRTKSIWIAVGDYCGERIEVKSTSAAAAEKHWLGAARFRARAAAPSRSA